MKYGTPSRVLIICSLEVHHKIQPHNITYSGVNYSVFTKLAKLTATFKSLKSQAQLKILHCRATLIITTLFSKELDLSESSKTWKTKGNFVMLIELIDARSSGLDHLNRWSLNIRHSNALRLRVTILYDLHCNLKIISPSHQLERSRSLDCNCSHVHICSNPRAIRNAVSKRRLDLNFLDKLWKIN